MYIAWTDGISPSARLARLASVVTYGAPTEMSVGDVSGSTTVVTYDGCIKKDERSENFHTINEGVARELIRAFQHSHSR